MRLKLFLMLLVSCALVSAFKAIPGIVHKNRAIATNHLDTIMKYQYRTIPLEIRK